MDVKDIVYTAVMVYINDSDLRIGQAMFNVLHSKHPELADKIRGTENDPFFAVRFDDVRVKNFINTITAWQNQSVTATQSE